MTPLLTISEAAKILRMSTDTVRRYALAGKIPCRRLGRKTLFTESDLASYIEACRFEREAPVRREGKIVPGKIQSKEYYLSLRRKQ
jgi:excisionase family DNA binding protein